MALKTMKIHPLCQMFTSLAPMPEAQKAELKEDIKQNGIKEPLLVSKDGKTLLDGLTRFRIAYDLKLSDKDVPKVKFASNDAKAIEDEIVSLNLHRRHMNDDQRVSIVSKLRGPQLEKEAKERQSAAGSFKGKAKLDGKGSVAEQIAKEAGTTVHKAKQAEKARKAGTLDDVIQKKTKLRSAAKKAPSRRKPAAKKEVPFADQVYKKWTQWINRFSPPQRREVMKLVKGWIG
jgi:ParB-like chromosome segregation protein Spo0J